MTGLKDSKKEKTMENYDEDELDLDLVEDDDHDALLNLLSVAIDNLNEDGRWFSSLTLDELTKIVEEEP